MSNRFIEMAVTASLNSEDPNTKVGCVLVYNGMFGSKHIVGTGFNHFPKPNAFPVDREGSVENTKYPYIIHAEQDALFNCVSEGFFKTAKPDTAYVTLFPCSNCAKLLVQFGIKRIYYKDDKYDGTPDNIASKRLLKECGVIWRYI